MQNTIANTGNSGSPRTPRGSVATGVGLAADTPLVAGQVTLPSPAGTYTVSLANGFAGVLRAGGPRPGTSIHPVDTADVTFTTSIFTVTVSTDPASPLSVDAGTGGWTYETMQINLQASVANPNNYPLIYSWAQTAGAPGTLGDFQSLGLAFTAPEVQTLQDAALSLAITASSDCNAQGTGSVDVQVRLMGDCYPDEGDNSVDVEDLLTLADAFGSVEGDADYNALCDFNSDGSIDVLDLLYIADNFGRSLASQQGQSRMMFSAIGGALVAEGQRSLRSATSDDASSLRDMNVYEALEYTGLMDVYLEYLVYASGSRTVVSPVHVALAGSSA